MTSDRKRERDRHVARYRRDLRARRRALAVSWLDLLHHERDLTLPGKKLAKLRSKLETERAEYLAEARSYRHDPRVHIDALFWFSWFSPEHAQLQRPGRRARKARRRPRVATQWDTITAAARLARLTVAWLDAGRMQVDRLGGDTAAIQKVAAQFAASTRTKPAKAAKAPPAGIPAPAWTAALDAWQGWRLGPKKGGRRPTGAVIYEPDRIVSDLLSAGGLKTRRGENKRDILGVRKQVQAADKILKVPANTKKQR